MGKNTISKERVERIQGIVTDYLDHEEIGEQDGVTAAELRALLAAYRTREAAMAECEAWKEVEAARTRYMDPDFEGPSGIDAAWEALKKARAATDAARREEVQGE